MKKILRIFVIDILILYFVSRMAEGMEFENGYRDIAFAGAGLTLANMVVKPVINVLMLPINLVTFNLFKWVNSAIALYLVTLVVAGFSISKFAFAGYASDLLVLPSINLSGFLAYVAFSFTITLIGSLLHWFIK